LGASAVEVVDGSTLGVTDTCDTDADADDDVLCTDLACG
jgi:hypothetical protein